MARIVTCLLMQALALIACVAWSDSFMSRALAQPSLTHASPAAILPGGSTRVVLHGDKLIAPLRIWTSAPVTIAVVDVKPQRATLDITPQQEMALGPVGLWVATADGLSAPISLLVDELPSTEENTDNHAPVTAQTLGMSAAIDGASDGKLSDFFRLHAEQGQEITFEVLAETIGSAFDPVVRLLTEDARELANVDDEAISPDCRFRHRFEKSGNYLLEIHDNRFAAGGRYRLRIGNFPLIAFAYPPVVQRGTCALLTFAGTDQARMAQRSMQIPDSPWQNDLSFTTSFEKGGSPGWANVRLDDSQQVSESEPNDTQSQANVVDAARGLNGLLEQLADRDYYKLSAKRDQTWRFAATSRSFGSATLLKMTLRNASGEVVGKTSVGDSDEWQFDVKFATDGDYFLEVEDLLHRGGPGHGYHISISTVAPFALSLKPDAKTRAAFAIQPTGGAAALDVVIKREGTKGPIQLSFEPEVEGLRILNPTLPADAKEARVYVLSQAGWTADKLHSLRCIGQAVGATEDAPTFKTALSTSGLLVLRAPHVPYPPAWQDGMIAVAAVADRSPLVELGLAQSPVAIPRPIADASFNLTIKRLEAGYKEGATLIHSDLPSDWTASGKAEKDNLVVALKHPLGLTSESAEIKLLWYTEFNGRGQVVESIIPLKLFDPLRINIAALQPMKAGKSQSVVIEVSREGAEPQPVVIKFQNLPKGLSAPETLMIPSTESKIEFEMTATADAAAGKTNTIVVKAQTKFGAQDVTVQSEPLELEVLASDISP